MKQYSNIHDSSTVSVTSTSTPTTYIDDLIKWVRNAKTEEDARWNAERILKEEVHRKVFQIEERLYGII